MIPFPGRPLPQLNRRQDETVRARLLGGWCLDGNQKAALAGGSERKVHRSFTLEASSTPAAMAEQGRDSAPEESDQ